MKSNQNSKTLSTKEILDYHSSQGAKRRAKKSIDLTGVTRFDSTVEKGLTAEQVNQRIEDGLTNTVNEKGGKSYLQIILSNIFTYLNLLTFVIFLTIVITAVAAQATDYWSQCVFMAVIAINTILGIVQEVRSKMTVSKMKIVTASTALIVRDGETRGIQVGDIVLDDMMYLEMGKQICADAIVVEGEIEVNESLLTGESAGVIKKPGDTIYSGSYVTSGHCYSRVEKIGITNYIETLSSYAKKYKKPKSDLHKAVKLIIKAVSIIMVPIAIGLIYTNYYNLAVSYEGWELAYNIVSKVSGALVGMIPAGMFLLTTVALAASIIRLAKKKVLVQDLYCIEMLARVDVLCLDKTGTITDGGMKVAKVIEFKSGANANKYDTNDIIGSMLSALEDNNQTSMALAEKFGYNLKYKPSAVVPFSSQRKLSACTFEGMGTFILGAPEFVLADMGVRIKNIVEENAGAGYRVLCLAHSPSDIKGDKLPGVRRPVCIIVIEDHIREEAEGTIRWFKENDVAVKIISGDNPKTVAEVARRVGVDNVDNYISLDGLSPREVVEAATKYTVFGRVSPEQKKILVQALKAKGHKVAMTGDGVNDILAMREADCSVTVASGADAAKNVAHVVLRDNNFNSMPDIVAEGRRVVNNIAASSSLFLMKTFMSILLAIATLVIGTQYFYQTNMLILLELFIIGAPSFFLALQPNRNRIEGNFISIVLRKAIPRGVVLMLSSLACYAYCTYAHGMSTGAYSDEFNTLLVLSLTFVGLVMLVRLCLPLNLYRACLVICSVLATIAVAFSLSASLGSSIFGITISTLGGENGLENCLFLSTVTLAAYLATSMLISLANAIKLGNASTEILPESEEEEEETELIED